MRIHNPGQDITVEASADLSTHQFKFVVGAALSGNSQQARVALGGANNRVFGVLQNKPSAAGQGAVVRISGVTKLVVDGSGSAIAVGNPLKSSTGVGILAGTDKDKVGAIALEASSASGDIIAALVCNYDLAV